MISQSFHHTIDFWISALDSYSSSQLLAKPSPSSWSIGQVYMHIIENTDWFFDQVMLCLSSNDNSDKKSSSEGKQMLLKNEFPNTQLQGPPDNDYTPQPKSKRDILENLKRQKQKVKSLEEAISKSRFNGKTQHPGLQYFNAAEWFQFAEMHLRHHMRQKKRIDEFLAKEE